MASYYQELYKEIKKDLQSKFNYKNPMQIPKLLKVSINMGVGAAAQDSKIINSAVNDLTLISGQKPVITRARKSIATFKLREKQPIGVKVTLRGARMYEFLERLTNIALPRSRDFRGLSPRGFDGRGNYSLGIKEQIVFPEINYDKIDKVRGMDVTIVTSATNNEEAQALLEGFRLPFRKQATK